MDILGDFRKRVTKVQMTTARAPSSFSDSPRHTLTLQRGHGLVYVRLHNTQVPTIKCSRSSIFFLVSSHRDLYYHGRKIINVNKASWCFVWHRTVSLHCMSPLRRTEYLSLNCCCAMELMLSAPLRSDTVNRHTLCVPPNSILLRLSAILFGLISETALF